MGGYAPRAREDSVRPRRMSGASGRPLNFTVRRLSSAQCHTGASYPGFSPAPQWGHYRRAPLPHGAITGVSPPFQFSPTMTLEPSWAC